MAVKRGVADGESRRRRAAGGESAPNPPRPRDGHPSLPRVRIAGKPRVLFADAEARENAVENVFGDRFASDFAVRTDGGTQVYCE